MIVMIVACTHFAGMADAAIYVTANERADVAHARARLVEALGPSARAQRTFDLSVAANVASTAVRADIKVDVRLVVSDDKGKMLAVLCATANASGRPGSIAKLRQQATTDAIVAIGDRLRDLK